MLTSKTSALIAAVSLLGAMAPAAFGQVSVGPTQVQNNIGVQTGVAVAVAPFGSASANVSQSISQGACLLAAGAVNDSSATAAQTALGDIDC